MLKILKCPAAKKKMFSFNFRFDLGAVQNFHLELAEYALQKAALRHAHE